MKVTYSPRFKRQYEELPPASQLQFQLVDAQVKADNVKVLRRNAWVWYTAIGGGYIAWGSLLEEEFYWRAVDVPEAVPIIL